MQVRDIRNDAIVPVVGGYNEYSDNDHALGESFFARFVYWD